MPAQSSMSPLPSPSLARETAQSAEKRDIFPRRWTAGWGASESPLNRERPHHVRRAARGVAPGSTGKGSPRPRHRLGILPPCSAASRVPSLALGGCAALDPACARCRSALVDGVNPVRIV